MAAKIPIGLLILAVFALASGCSATSPIKGYVDAVALLNVAIVSLDDGSVMCEASEFSTEDALVLQVLRDRTFEIISYEAEVQDEEVEHRFILQKLGSKMLLSADIIALNGDCSGYTFSQIAQDEAHS